MRYRRPQSDDTETDVLYDTIKLASQKHALIMGDFNYPKTDWISLDSDSAGSKFVDLVQDCFLHQSVLYPTRGDNILDLILVSEEAMVHNLCIGEHFNTSEHNIVTWDLICKQTIVMLRLSQGKF